jgi:hypothetical protein
MSCFNSPITHQTHYAFEQRTETDYREGLPALRVAENAP